MKLRVNIEGALQVETIPPPMAQSAFDEVTKAQQTKSTEVNKAETYARTNVSSAYGEAQAILNEAITRSNQLVLTVQAEAKAFTNQLPFYAANPELFKERLMSETMQLILPAARDKYLNLLPSQGELRLQLNREPLKEKE
jgi:membrane protease subunit HflK